MPFSGILISHSPTQAPNKIPILPLKYLAHYLTSMGWRHVENEMQIIDSLISIFPFSYNYPVHSVFPPASLHSICPITPLNFTTSFKKKFLCFREEKSPQPAKLRFRFPHNRVKNLNCRRPKNVTSQIRKKIKIKWKNY